MIIAFVDPGTVADTWVTPAKVAEWWLQWRIQQACIEAMMIEEKLSNRLRLARTSPQKPLGGTV